MTPVPSFTPIVPARVPPPADLISFLRKQLEYEEPVEVQEIDLNNDGVPELLAKYSRCGSGGCMIHLFQRSGNGFKELSGSLLNNLFASLNDDRYGSFTAGPHSTNGYLDLRYRFKIGGKTVKFQFDGQSYRGVQ